MEIKNKGMGEGRKIKPRTTVREKEVGVGKKAIKKVAFKDLCIPRTAQYSIDEASFSKLSRKLSTLSSPLSLSFILLKTTIYFFH